MCTVSYKTNMTARVGGGGILNLLEVSKEKNSIQFFKEYLENRADMSFLSTITILPSNNIIQYTSKEISVSLSNMYLKMAFT